MSPPFFPGPVFGWAFVLVLTGLILAAAWTDLRTMLIPKRLTLTLLPLGLLFNVARGAWLGAQGGSAWALGPHGAFAGALDGALFAVTGFLVGFALFFLLWLLGTCGGGDVKLFAALGAWVGAYFALWVLAGTVLVVMLVAGFRLLTGFFGSGYRGIKQYTSRDGRPREPGGRNRPRRRLITYSLPLAVTTAAVLLWSLRVDLHLAAPRKAPEEKVEAHAR
ncbi:MAG TPA: A24 family peptidase [Gemmataceae bacterium]|jgi:prepilin peptidase CpaA|nr:A24 family peptidase [Gemmataceae bacterium]